MEVTPRAYKAPGPGRNWASVASWRELRGYALMGKENQMEKNNHDLEKGMHTRVAVDAYVSATLTTDGAHAERIFTTKDISAEGIFLVTKEAFPLGTILNLKIHTPFILKPINVEAEVVRVARDENSAVTGMGLVLINMNKEVREELFKHLYLVYHSTEIDKKG